jgi:pimeloyl-ACP methyl ester carboxylesterase
MALAANHPRRVRTLTLVAAPVFEDQKSQDKFVPKGYSSREEALLTMGTKGWATAIYGAPDFFPPEIDPGLRDWYVGEIGKSDPAVLCGLYGLLRHASAKDFLPRIEAPALGLYPTSGPITDAEQERQLATGIKKLNLIHLPTKYHAILTLKPALCAQAVLHFAAAHDGIPCHE